MILFFFSLLFLSFFAHPVLAAPVCESGQSRDDFFQAEISDFLDKGAFAYLVWQYSGDRGREFENDPYSFFRGDTLCQTLKQFSGRVGVNIHGLANKDPGVIQDHLNYLKNDCGVAYIRLWANSNFGNPAKIKSTVDIINSLGLKAILALADYPYGSPEMPSSIHTNPTSWYSPGGHTAYLSWVSQVVDAVGNSAYIYELANEPHCNGIPQCPPVYNQWAAEAATLIRSKSSSQVGIGQMASQPTTLGDSPPTDFEASNSSGSITVTSAHYYNSSEKQSALTALSSSQKLSKPFYIGEAGDSKECLTLPPGCSLLEPNIPPIKVSKDYVKGPPTTAAFHQGYASPEVVPNDISKEDKITCTKTYNLMEYINLAQETLPDGSRRNIAQWVGLLVKTLTNENNFTNNGDRNFSPQADPLDAGLELPPGNTNWTKLTTVGMGTSKKMRPFDWQTEDKCARMNRAVENRVQKENTNTTTADDQIAYDCGGQCKSIICADPAKGCRIVRISELAYFLSRLPDKRYDCIRPAGSHPELQKIYPDSIKLPDNCYEKMYQLLEIVDVGNYDSEIGAVSDKDDGSTETKTTRQADPGHAYFTNNFDIMVKPYNQDNIASDPCATIEKPPSIDRPSPITIGQVVKAINRLIQDPSLAYQITVTTSFSKKVTDGMSTSATKYANLAPYEQSKDLQQKPDSSIDAAGGPVHVGYKVGIGESIWKTNMTPFGWTP